MEVMEPKNKNEKNIVTIRLTLDRELHKKLRVYSIEEGKLLKEFIPELIKMGLQRYEEMKNQS